MSLPILPPYPPMEALLVDEIPTGGGWQYEPKWDGFRALAFRDGNHVELQSKSGQPLARYFPEIVAALLELKAHQFVLDGELTIPIGEELSFDELLLRIHPAASRIQKLSQAHPAMLVVFDLLVDASGKSLVELPLAERRIRLQRFAEKYFPAHPQLRLSPATTNIAQAQKWFGALGQSLDGLIAKRVELPYQSGQRHGMEKIKPVRSADCVVGGFRYTSDGTGVGSLLLGLYDDEGLLHHVGFTSSLRADQRKPLVQTLAPLISSPGFTGRAPGGPSRWSTKRSTQWQPLKPRRVVEVKYDHFTGNRFRHGTKFLRWRPDKSPQQCTFAQVKHKTGRYFNLLAP